MNQYYFSVDNSYDDTSKNKLIEIIAENEEDAKRKFMEYIIHNYPLDFEVFLNICADSDIYISYYKKIISINE